MAAVTSFLPLKFNSPVMSTKPRAVLDSASKMRASYGLKQGQSRLFHELPSGLNMELIVQKGAVDNKDPDDKCQTRIDNPSLVFVHGSYHAAWCWAEHWLPFFSSHGYDCYALSLLGQGESDAPTDSVAGTLQTHAGDIAHFIHRTLKSPPVLLGHSFGGLIIQYYIASIKNGRSLGKENLYPELGGAVLVCSVPPSGNSGLVWRYLFSKPIAAFKVTRSLAAKAFQTSLPLCRETFFSANMEDQLVLRSLPVPSVPKSSIELLVLGAKNDFIVDTEGLNETGKFYGVSPVCVEGVAHDLMLDCSWEKGAKANQLTRTRELSTRPLHTPNSRRSFQRRVSQLQAPTDERMKTASQANARTLSI
ncbi:hypothetical protein G4B88_005528 [Cannabis sativa]|uniref:AB hydrolase-1 domain-containing protein n=1 Tax=Cannabis sativa TaxID=3483 RepID=A0A7J6H834_CANSA|nr:hypothetical protein G4B88_005528 [Cannabis sativa]